MFPQILGVFYAVFHPTQGSKAVCQAPDGVVVGTNTSEVAEPLISFDSLKNYIIPKPGLCNRLVGLRYGNYQIVGHPVNIVGEDYERNSFTFNFVFIFRSEDNATPFESAITRTAKMFRALEEQSRYLSNPENLLNIDSAIEQMYQDLNSYSECQIPIDDSNKIDIKLFPILEAPPPIQPYNVPLTTVKLASLIDDTWDPTLERIVPFINGVNSVRTIADLAEADYDLTRQCIQHLIHYECVVIMGILQFANVYAPTPDLETICDPKVYGEFCAFAYHPLAGTLRQSGNSQGPDIGGASSAPSIGSGSSSTMMATGGDGAPPLLTMAQVLRLYAAFQGGLNLYSWYNDNRDLLHYIDVRRFLTFGVLKQLIYRVHAYPVYDSARRAAPTVSNIRQALKDADLDSTPENVAVVQRATQVPMHMDAICTELRASRAQVSKALRSIGEWVMLHA